MLARLDLPALAAVRLAPFVFCVCVCVLFVKRNSVFRVKQTSTIRLGLPASAFVRKRLHEQYYYIQCFFVHRACTTAS